MMGKGEKRGAVRMREDVKRKKSKQKEEQSNNVAEIISTLDKDLLHGDM